ncbi:MAG TPA: exosortase/archaeosortase family protein [Candidatus Methylacidiphilales bacterium]
MNDATRRRDLPPWLLPLLPLIVLFVGLFGCFPYLLAYGNARVSVFRNLWYQWNVFGQGEWSYGVAVPFIVAAMVWYRREAWRGFVPEPDRGFLWIGLLVAGGFCFWVGYVVDLIAAAFLSIHFFLAGAVVGLLGRKAFLRLLAPWLFLLFAYPAPFLDNALAFQLRLIMTAASHALLSGIGIANVQIGTAIVSAPNPIQGLPEGGLFSIDVADPCSGIRSLFALLMMATLYGYFVLPKGWRRGALVLLAVPLAVVGNIARIVLLVFGVLLFGSPFAIGTTANPSAFHEGVGLVVYGVALGGLVLAVHFLTPRAPRAPRADAEPKPPSPPPAPNSRDF